MPTRQTQRMRTTHTFVVRMLHTDDSSWTGVVTHVRSGRSASFRGFIEAIRFIDRCMARSGIEHQSVVGGGADDVPDDGGRADARLDEPGPPAVGQSGFT